MNLVIDAGNTLIKIAVYNAGVLVAVENHPDWPETAFQTVLDRYPAIDYCLACSTRGVPGWLPEFMASHGVIFKELSYRMPLPVSIGYETPDTLGNDRIAAAAGAASMCPGRNILVIDAGTALTLDLVTAGGTFEGGNISPGLRMRFHALHTYTYNLPDISPDGEIPMIGRNTRQAILAGVVNGMVYEIDNSINSLKNKYYDLTVVMTGGDAPYLSRLIKNAIFVEENLVLNGLNAILRHFSG